MTFPLKDFQLPIEGIGTFGAVRKYDIHTGIDFYCYEKEKVVAIEDGEVVSTEWFTGPHAGSPWWNNTRAIAIKGKSGIIVYGEIFVISALMDNSKRCFVKEGEVLGDVHPVLKKDKGVVPSLSMLHIELYKSHKPNDPWISWELNQPQPENLLNPNFILELGKEANGILARQKLIKDMFWQLTVNDVLGIEPTLKEGVYLYSKISDQWHTKDKAYKITNISDNGEYFSIEDDVETSHNFEVGRKEWRDYFYAK